MLERLPARTPADRITSVSIIATRARRPVSKSVGISVYPRTHTHTQVLRLIHAQLQISTPLTHSWVQESLGVTKTAGPGRVDHSSGGHAYHFEGQATLRFGRRVGHSALCTRDAYCSSGLQQKELLGFQHGALTLCSYPGSGRGG